MSNWLKKHIPSAKSMQNSKQLTKLKSFLNAPCYWSSDQQCVARGVAAGLAGCVIPGVQFFYAAALVIILRGNLPIALACTLVTNPLTFVPITYFIYLVGTYIIGNDTANFVVNELQWNFSSFHAFWSSLSDWVLQFGKAFLVGLPIVSLCLGIIGYFGTILLFKVYYLVSGKK